MTSIVSTSNLEDYNKAGIVGVLPRSMKIENRIYYAVELSNSPNFVSFSMAEAENIFAKPNSCDYIKRRFEKLNKSYFPRKSAITLTTPEKEVKLGMTLNYINAETEWETRTEISNKYREVTVDEILRRFMSL